MFCIEHVSGKTEFGACSLAMQAEHCLRPSVAGQRSPLSRHIQWFFGFWICLGKTSLNSKHGSIYKYAGVNSKKEWKKIIICNYPSCPYLTIWQWHTVTLGNRCSHVAEHHRRPLKEVNGLITCTILGSFHNLVPHKGRSIIPSIYLIGFEKLAFGG